MKQKLLVWIALVILITSIIVVVYGYYGRINSPDMFGSSYDFIVYSDTHVGQKAKLVSGSDNMSCSDRYSLMLGRLNQYQTSFILDVGDCIAANTMRNQPLLLNFYGQYLNITANSLNTVLQVKGNHDCNITLYEQMMGSLNWAKRFGDILAVGIGATTDDGLDWTKNLLYDNITNQFLQNTVTNIAYNQTTYHFLFMHFQPTSKFTSDLYMMSPSTLQYLRYFNIVFCGHEAGCSRTFVYNGTRCVHVAHMDWSVKTDEFVTVRIDRTLNRITVAAFNFWQNTTTIIYQQP
jgi:hypothetical protein